jgi:hypothetical protein
MAPVTRRDENRRSVANLADSNEIERSGNPTSEDLSVHLHGEVEKSFD